MVAAVAVVAAAKGQRRRRGPGTAAPSSQPLVPTESIEAIVAIEAIEAIEAVTQYSIRAVRYSVSICFQGFERITTGEGRGARRQQSSCRRQGRAAARHGTSWAEGTLSEDSDGKSERTRLVAWPC